MSSEGPSLEALVQWVLETPADFLAPLPLAKDEQSIVQSQRQVAALLHDVTHGMGLNFDQLEGTIATFKHQELRVLLLVIWLLAAPGMTEYQRVDHIHNAVTEDVRTLSEEAPASSWHGDAEHREELVRLVLRRFDLRPHGETETQAQDRLSGISSIDRRRVMLESRQAEQRAEAIRQALLAEEAQRSADKATRE